MRALLKLLLHVQESLLEQGIEEQFFGKVHCAIVWQDGDWRVTTAVHRPSLRSKASLSFLILDAYGG